MIDKAIADLNAILARLREFRDELVIMARPPKKGRVIRGIGMRKKPEQRWTAKRIKKAKKFVRALGGHKTARMMVVLADGKRHTAKELALAGNTTTGHVHTHLAGRLKKGLVKRPAAGIFQLAAKKKAA
jgi:tRNA 2-selenouridine synthase SelU